MGRFEIILTANNSAENEDMKIIFDEIVGLDELIPAPRVKIF